MMRVSEEPLVEVVAVAAVATDVPTLCKLCPFLPMSKCRQHSQLVEATQAAEEEERTLATGILPGIPAAKSLEAMMQLGALTLTLTLNLKKDQMMTMAAVTCEMMIWQIWYLEENVSVPWA
jgi:hypothetical protein